jgi:hypothetical protein
MLLPIVSPHSLPHMPFPTNAPISTVPCPDHSATANGNIGLVKYTLSCVEAVNSVLDGVLPLHAASCGGNDLVVKLLIEEGVSVFHFALLTICFSSNLLGSSSLSVCSGVAFRQGYHDCLSFFPPTPIYLYFNTHYCTSYLY